MTRGAPSARQAPTLRELLNRAGQLPEDQAATLIARIQPAPRQPEFDADDDRPLPRFASWADFLARTTAADRQRWCGRKAKTANRERLMSGRPEAQITGSQVWAVLESARGRCAHCGSLAVENRPSKPNGAPAPWAAVGRRIGSLEHVESRFEGGANCAGNLAWCCLWCNTWQTERRLGATDHGGWFPDC